MKVLAVHPNYELYGSDRSFANLIGAMLDDGRYNVKVLFPQRGPILSLPAFSRAEVVIRSMWILRRRDLFRGLTVGLPKNIGHLWQALRDMNCAELVYINTVIGIDFLLMARFCSRPVIIHVREIPNGIEMTLFRALLLWSKAVLIFNSEATRKAFRLPDSVRSYFVYNGQQPVANSTPSDWNGIRPLRILMVGRVNHWKGQETLIAAIGKLSSTERQRVAVRIVGSTFNGQDDFLDALKDQIAALGLQNVVSLEPFVPDPSALYRDSDLVVVPSRLPEPFGRVAIEAMSFSRVVVATAHGGLVEIVQDGRTGLLFPPSDSDALAGIVRRFLVDPPLLSKMGRAGHERFLDMFTTAATNSEFLKVVRGAIA